MKKMEQKLIEIVKSMKGNFIGIGLDQPRLVNEVENNHHIVECILLNDRQNELNDLGKSKIKKINIRKLRRKFKKKKRDYIIASLDEIYPYYKTFIKDSVYITRGTIYYYGSSKEKMDLIIKKYERYKVKIREEMIGKEMLLTIEVNKAKTNRIKDFFYYIKDTLNNGMDYISDYLIH